MAHQRVDDRRLLEALLGLFQERGYEGASLSLIAERTGLKRASLYHRFPGGKLDMALAVLGDVHQTLGSEVLAVLGGSGSAKVRVRKAAQALDRFYAGGRRACLLDTLSLGDQGAAVRAALATSMQAMVSGFAGVARESGHTARQAQRLGEEVLVRLEGALVFARVAEQTQPFERLMRELPELLCDAPVRR